MNNIFSITTFRNLTILCTCLALIQCKTEPVLPLTDLEVATKWAELSIDITKNTPANSPTYASRCFGYIGLTMYESIVPGYPKYHSMVNQVNDLNKLPSADKDLSYLWDVSLNAGQAFIIKSLYNQTVDSNKIKIDSLEKVILENITADISDQDLVNRSVLFGQSIAESIFQWAKIDGGHRAYLRNIDKSFTPQVFPGSWKPPLYAQSISHHPLHPYWGQNRTFVKANSELPDPQMIPYDTLSTSPYYQQFVAVYEKDKTLTQAEKEAALWWGDDPSDTFTPPGHSYYIATIALNAKDASLIQCAETYAKLGMAVADAFILCWKWKYHFFSERPNTFIPQFIEQEWESFWPDPPFPSFPSGHAIQAATAAYVFIDQFGDEFSFTDEAHIGRERDELREVDFVARTFNRFSEVATETANSRFYGGIHTQQDNDVGLEEGEKIARNVNDLKWKNN